MLSNHPNTLGGGSTTSGGGETGVFTNVLVGNGSATAPSYSFSSDTNTGLYLDSSHTLGWTFNGVEGATFSGGAGGGLTITAIGTNQNITLTPSGTGIASISNALNADGYILQTTKRGTTSGIYHTSSNVQFGAIGGTTGLVLFSSNASAQIDFQIGATQKVRIAPTTGNFLLNGLTTDGTGVLQFPAATTSAGGINFAAHMYIYRSNTTGTWTFEDTTNSSPAITLKGTDRTATWGLNANADGWNTGGGRVSLTRDSSAGGNDALRFRASNDSATYGAIGADSTSGGLVIKTGSSPTTAITLDSSQNGFAAGSTFGFHTSATGGATSSVKLIKAVTAIANNTATDVLTVTIPNTANSASIRVRLAGSLGAGGAVGANEATGTVEYLIAVSRVAANPTTAVASTAFGSANASVAGGATITVTAAVTGNTGGSSATQTFTVQATIARGSGSSTNHTCQVDAEILNANAGGISIA